MFNLPVNTHRMLIEPITGYSHVSKILVSRFLGFLQQINKSKKSIPKLLLGNISYDVRSTTGKSLRKIMLLANKTCIEEVRKSDAGNIPYHPVNMENKWKVDVIKEMLDAREGKLEVEGFTQDEVTFMINHLCTS